MCRREKVSILLATLLLVLPPGGTSLLTGQDSCYLQSLPEPTCAGLEVDIFTTDNPILDSPSLKARIRCDDSGVLRTGIALEGGAMLYFSMGTHLARLYAVPGENYMLKLPPCRTMSRDERMSPYFTPALVSLQAVNQEGDINSMLLRFEPRYMECNEAIIRKRQMGISTGVDSMISVLEKEFTTTGQPWFDDYMRYRHGLMALNAGECGLACISEEYLGHRVNESHPAYMELFSAMYRDFLTYYSHRPEGRGIARQINRDQDLDSLRRIVYGHPSVTSPAMADLVLLHELPRLFYSGDYHKEAILILLDSLEAAPAKASLGKYAGEIRASLASLLTGNEPPAFRLEDGEGGSWGPRDAQGKYCYLMFCTPEHYGCMMEYPFLQSFQSRHSEYLDVVCIMVAENRDRVRSFMEQNAYTFRALYYGNNGSLLSDYRVRAYPVAYLIGPDGKLILSPSPLPSDQFEQRLFTIMRSRGEI